MQQIQIEKLSPKEKMKVNELCWCNSGKKWKKCHRCRELQKPVIIGELLSRIKCEFRKGDCLHPEASTNN